MWYVGDVLNVCVDCFVVGGCAVTRRYVGNCDMFSVVNVYLVALCCVYLWSKVCLRYSAMVSLMNVMSPPLSCEACRLALMCSCVS